MNKTIKLQKNLLSLVIVATFGFVSSASADNIIDINSKMPSEGTDSTYISGFSFDNKKVTYHLKNGHAIFEGDILLGTAQQAKEWANAQSNISPNQSVAPKSIIRTGQRYRWPNNLIPYRFAENVSEQTRNTMLNAMNHWRDNTSIEFVERTAENEGLYPDFVTIVSDEEACKSNVGRLGGEQIINVFDRCGFGASVHEIGHTLGLWHEHSREDRDQFVIINWDNIDEDDEDNFKQHIFDGDDLGPYDYGSIMHYGRRAFSMNGQDTITPLDPDVFIGQMRGLSDLDIAGIMQNYPEYLPVAKLNKSHYSIYLGNPVTFDGSRSFDPNGEQLVYFWSFGDGTELNPGRATVEHVYEERGTYQVSLRVLDADFATDSTTATAYVYGIEDILPSILHALL